MFGTDDCKVELQGDKGQQDTASDVSVREPSPVSQIIHSSARQ